MKPQDIGRLLLVFCPWFVADSFGQRFDETYPHVMAYAVSIGLLIGGLLLITMKGNKR